MISVLPSENRNEIEMLFCQHDLSFNEYSGCVIARCGEEKLGYCLYDLNEKGILIRCLEPADDLMLADGILRSALHVAAQRSAMDAHYDDTVSITLLLRLQFIADEKDKKLDIDKLFRGCGCKHT